MQPSRRKPAGGTQRPQRGQAMNDRAGRPGLARYGHEAMALILLEPSGRAGSSGAQLTPSMKASRAPELRIVQLPRPDGLRWIDVDGPAPAGATNCRRPPIGLDAARRGRGPYPTS